LTAGERDRSQVIREARLDPERLGPLVGHLSHREMSTVDIALKVVLGLA
jgi:hypothetical protein